MFSVDVPSQSITKSFCRMSLLLHGFFKPISSAITFFREGKLRSVSRAFVSLLATYALFSAGSAFAVSPMPTEIEKNIKEKIVESNKQQENDTMCTIRIVYATDTEMGKPLKDDYVTTVFFEPALPKNEVFEKVIGHIEEKLKEEHVADIFIECRFHAHVKGY